MTTRVYGITNCDTVKKARAWLDRRKVSYEFHDLRAESLTTKQVKTWLKDLGAEQIINKRSTTWKNLSAKQRRDALNAEAAVALILAQPTLIKRPLLEKEERKHIQRLCGFKESAYLALFS